jgi:hypothetical protein
VCLLVLRLGCRQPKDFERDRFHGSVSIPAVSVAGFGAGAAVAPVAEFVGNMLAKFSDLDSKLLLVSTHAPCMSTFKKDVVPFTKYQNDDHNFEFALFWATSLVARDAVLRVK